MVATPTGEEPSKLGLRLTPSDIAPGTARAISDNSGTAVAGTVSLKCLSVPPGASSSLSSSSLSSTKTKKAVAKVLAPTDRDVLCGRGKGIRFHPGNVLFNKLLKEHYPEYGRAPKGSKLEIVKKIVHSIREGQADGTGRFLEQKKTEDGNGNGGDTGTSTSKSQSNTGARFCYLDIGDERAMNKTAQAFRDIRVTEEKRQQSNGHGHGHPNKKRKTTSMNSGLGAGDANTNTNTNASISFEEDSAMSVSGSPRASPFLSRMGRQRRPTFKERLAMLHRPENNDDDDEDSCSLDEGEEGDSDNDDDDDDDEGSNEERGNDDDISDTETEDSFPMYKPNKHTS